MLWSNEWGIPCLLLAIPTVLFLIARLRYSQIPKLVPASEGTPDCMVVIPARNEQALISKAVRSFPKDSVIVVDDGSSDKTAANAREAGAGVITAPELTRRAFGKPGACHVGAAHLESKWILFADADTSYAPGFLDSVVQTAEASKMDFVSVHLPVETRVREEGIGPYAQALYYSAVNAKSKPLAAFLGQCILVRREPYQFIGGHHAVLKYFTEDRHLAASALRHRMRFGTVRAGKLGSARFHLDGVIGGLHRQVFRALDSGGMVLLATLFTATCAALYLPCAIWLWVGGSPWAALAALSLPWIWLAGWYRGWSLLLAPVAIYATLPVLWVVVFPVLTGSAPQWKGRDI